VGDETVDSFSRDQYSGLMAYMLATNDRSALIRWAKWVESNGYRMCKESSDDRCNLQINNYQMIRKVMLHLDISPWGRYRTLGSIPIDPIQLLLETKYAPLGYTLHLSGVTFWLHMVLRTFDNQTPHLRRIGLWRLIPKILVKRQPRNPFFLYLKGKYLNDPQSLRLAATETISKCPSHRPASSGLDWAWQRSEVEQTWLKSSGHDCLFISNLLLDAAGPL
jgi:hypothetical protein